METYYNFTLKILSTVFSSWGTSIISSIRFLLCQEKKCLLLNQRLLHLAHVALVQCIVLTPVDAADSFLWDYVMLFCYHSRSDPLIQRALLAGDHIAFLNTGFQRSCRISVNLQVTGAHEMAFRKQYGNQLYCGSSGDPQFSWSNFTVGEPWDLEMSPKIHLRSRGFIGIENIEGAPCSVLAEHHCSRVICRSEAMRNYSLANAFQFQYSFTLTTQYSKSFFVSKRSIKTSHML